MIVERHLIYHINELGLHIVLHYKWEWNDEKNVLILWKLISIWMKILNDIACNLNGIQIPLNWIVFTFDWIEIK